MDITSKKFYEVEYKNPKDAYCYGMTGEHKLRGKRYSLFSDMLFCVNCARLFSPILEVKIIKEKEE